MDGHGRTLERTIEEIERYEGILKLLQEFPDEMSHLHLPLVQDRLETSRKTVECVEQGKPFVATWYTNAPEICTAMDLHWYCQVAGAFVSAIESPHTMEDLELIASHLVVSPWWTALSICLAVVSVAIRALDSGFGLAGSVARYENYAAAVGRLRERFHASDDQGKKLAIMHEMEDVAAREMTLFLSQQSRSSFGI